MANRVAWRNPVSEGRKDAFIQIVVVVAWQKDIKNIWGMVFVLIGLGEGPCSLITKGAEGCRTP